MNIFATAALLACLCVVESSADNNTNNKVKIGIDKREVCKIKKTCVECLHLDHCSWCKTEKKCFSNTLKPLKCINDTNEYKDNGFSFLENAKCSCNEEPEPKCYPSGTDETKAAPCSGRGECVCGRCVCETHHNSTKIVMGEYCEFDNFSCDGPGCNEGPYSLKQTKPEESLKEP